MTRCDRRSAVQMSPARLAVFCCFMYQSGACTRRRLAGSRGSAQPKRWLSRSSNASHIARLAGPGGSILKLRRGPSDREIQRGAKRLTSSLPRCVCVVANTGGRHWSGTPAKAISVQSPTARSTAPRAEGSPALNAATSTSSAAKVITAERYFNWPGAMRIAARASAGSPIRISGTGSRRTITMPRNVGLGTAWAEGYSTASWAEGPSGSLAYLEKLISMAARHSRGHHQGPATMAWPHAETPARSPQDAPAAGAHP